MSKERYNQIIDEVYLNYSKNYFKEWESAVMYGSKESFTRRLMKEEFINNCKTDPEFSEKWGLKIEERDLSLEERIRIYALKEGQTYEEFVTNWDTEEQWLDDLSDTTIPTKLITLEYNNEKIEIYE